MDVKQAIVTTLLGMVMYSVLVTGGQMTCPWCNKSMQTRLLDCVYTELIGRPELTMVPLHDIENIRWEVSSYSDSITDMPDDAKKVAVDKKFVSEMTNLAKKNNIHNSPALTNAIFELGGQCYSSVTGYDASVVMQDIQAMGNDEIRKSSAPPGGNPNLEPNSRMPYSANQNQQGNFPPFSGGNPNLEPNSRMPYSANQNQQGNFQPFQPLNQQLVNNAPFNPPGAVPAKNAPFNPPDAVPANNAPFSPPMSSPVNSFENRAFKNNAPFSPPVSLPVNSYENPAFKNNAPFSPPVSSPVNSFENPAFKNNAPFSPPVSSPVNSFENPAFKNNAPRSSPENPLDYPQYGNNAPLNPTVSSRTNPSTNPSLDNNAPGPSENSPSNNNGGQYFSKNQAPSSGPPVTTLQNDKSSLGYENPPDYAVLVSTASPGITSPSQDSKTIDLDSSSNSNWATLSPYTDAPQKKATENEKPDDEVPCDEKFKIAFYEKLLNDDRFCSFFEKLPMSSTKPEVPKLINHAFREYGVEEHCTEFNTFWRFESRALNKESTVKDWDEVMSKIMKIIFSRNNLLKEDCEEAGKKLAGYILDAFPGNPATLSTDNTNQNNGNDEVSTESNSSSSVQQTNPASSSTENTPAKDNSSTEKSTDSEDLSFPELHSTLASIFKHDGSTKQNGEKPPFSELLTAFETHQNLEKLYNTIKSCISPSGFDLDKLLPTMSDVTASIQKNHPDWSHDKCQKEMYSATVAVLTKALQDAIKSKNDSAKSQPSSTQSDSDVGASDSQISNSGSQPDDYTLPSDDSTYPIHDTDLNSDNFPQPAYDGDYADGTRPVDIPPSENQPGSGDWNAGLNQPSDFAPGPANKNYGDFGNDNPQNAPFLQPERQNSPRQDYPAAPTTNMNPRPFSGTQPFPASPNERFQQPSNFAPNSGGMNFPNGNNQFHAANRGSDYGFNPGPSEVQPALSNGDSQNFPPRQDYDSGIPASGPVRPNYNSQPQFDSNYNSRVPANGPAIPQW